MEDADDFIGDTRNFVSKDEGLECQYAAEQPLTGGSPLRCIGNEVGTCSIPGIPIPTTPPSPAPTEELSSSAAAAGCRLSLLCQALVAGSTVFSSFFGLLL